ncbi:MAG: hypothetical protein ABI995_08740 [Acidobacteriota bacterium]
MFGDWRIIEAREHLRLADGRKSAMDQLKKCIDNGALEVQQMQPLLVQNLWLFDTAWTEANEQQTYSRLLRDTHREPKNLDEKNRRLDILGVTDSGKLTVVEIKRPEKILDRTDLEQLEHYVDWARQNLLGTGPDSHKSVEGLLIVGKLSQKGEVSSKMQRLAGDGMRVQTYADLHNSATRQFSAQERRLEQIAPEYARSARKKTSAISAPSRHHRKTAVKTKATTKKKR